MGIRLNAAPAPDFEAVDNSGRLFNLSDYRKKKHVMLVLNRGFI